jgi:two-component system, OmpR family, sensor histidine kinase CpxA
MRSTFTKIFLSYWLAQFLIAACTIFMSIRQFDAVAIGYASSFTMMHTLAKQSIDAYESGGCAAMQRVPNTFSLGKPGPADQPAILLDPSNRPLCQQIDMGPYATAVQKIRKNGYMLGVRRKTAFLLGLEVKDAHGQKYVYLMRGTFPSEISIPFREMVPRLIIAITISLIVTFGITLVITRPIGSLREAARQLSAGNLAARAKPAGGRPMEKGGDELRGLIYDFNEMAERLQALVDAHKLLLRDVSHELRSPLARLSVALEWAREEAKPGIEDQLERMENEVVRLNALIGQLLSLSHLESAARLPETRQFSVAQVVEELLPDLEYEADVRNVHVEFRRSDSNIGMVSGSPELLARAIENVIRNAISYTAEGSPVEVSLSSQQSDGASHLVLHVRDHGPGVPENALSSIFRPFYRLDDSRRRSTGGFGVGLAIAERAVHLHGGEIAARNAENGGLMIEITLPISEGRIG